VAAADRVHADELAIRVGTDRRRIDELADLGVIERDESGRFAVGDVHRIRLLAAFEAAGVPLDPLVAASRDGRISLRYYDELHPSPLPLSGRTYRSFRASFGPDAALLDRLYAALGLAQPADDARLTVDDEALLTELIEIIQASGAPDLALRAIRLFGEGARKAADGALGVYGEAAGRLGDSLTGLPVDDQFDRLLRPWARFAQQAGRLAGWLASSHLTRAIDEYSVMETERTLEAAGFVPARTVAQPAVAFVDLTGFTRLTEERGDEAAAAVALRLGELATEVIETTAGRIVKLLGDGVLLRFGDAVAAMDGALDLLDALPRDRKSVV